MPRCVQDAVIPPLSDHVSSLVKTPAIECMRSILILSIRFLADSKALALFTVMRPAEIDRRRSLKDWTPMLRRFMPISVTHEPFYVNCAGICFNGCLRVS